MGDVPICTHDAMRSGVSLREGRRARRALEVRVQELTDELMAVVVLAAEHAIDSVRDGGPLVPFVLSESSVGTRRLQRILIGSPADLSTSVARARALAGRRAGEEAVVACAYSGQLGTGPDAQHAIFVEARAGRSAAVVFAQCYRPRRRLRPLRPLGNLAFLGEAERLAA
jgi:hypothetical protein